MGPFAFVQLEFGFLLGPPDGRFLIRSHAGADPERILVLSTLGAPQRRSLRDRKGRSLEAAQPAPVPTSRATVVRPEPFDDAGAADAWLTGVRGERELAEEESRSAVRVLNRALRAHRAARADPHAREVSAQQALVVRIGYGDGHAVADGRYASAWEPPRRASRTRRSVEAPEERFAALLGAREHLLACEELVLRARADIEAGRPREAALQARIALESLLAEAAQEIAEGPRAQLEDDRGPVGEAANAALRGALAEPLRGAVDAAVARMEGALRARRRSGAT